jgi:trehalose-phosphatase
MNRTLNDALEGAVGEYIAGSRLMLLADYDGTLTEFADRPQRATLPAPTRVVLATLAAQPRVTVGIISGRELDDLKQMVGLPGLFYAGSSGLECDLQGELTAHPLLQHTNRLVSELALAIEPLLRGFPGVWLERKQFGLTIHYRELDADRVPHLQGRLEQELAKWGDRLHVVTGAKAIEIIPNLGWTKGAAVELFLQRVGPKPRRLIYVGDETCDLEVLWEVGIHHGITIGVGHNSPTTAQYELQDPEAVEHLLEKLCEAVGGAGLEASNG